VESGVGVRRLPTHYGVLHFRAHAENDGLWKVAVDGDLQMPLGGIVLQLPWPRPIRSMRVNGLPSTTFSANEARVTVVPAEVELVFEEEQP
jgi:hypothetical protein